MADSRNRILFWTCIPVAVIMVVIIGFLMNAYFSIIEINWGLELEKKEDAIQWSLFCAAVATGALILMYVLFSKQQADAVRRQLALSLTPTIIFEPYPIEIGRGPHFDPDTKGRNHITLNYRITNLSDQIGEYTLDVIPYLIPKNKFHERLNYRNTIAAPYSNQFIQIVETDT